MVTITDGWRKDSTVVGGFFRGMSTTRGGVAEMVEGAPAGGGIGGEPASDWVKEFVSPILEDLRGGCGGPDVAEWARANQEQLLEQLVNYWTKYWELVTPILQGVGLENHPTFYCTGVMVSWCWFVDWQPFLEACHLEMVDRLENAFTAVYGDISVTGGLETITRFLEKIPEERTVRAVFGCEWDFTGTPLPTEEVSRLRGLHRVRVTGLGLKGFYSLLRNAHLPENCTTFINSVPQPPHPDKCLVADYILQAGVDFKRFVAMLDKATASGRFPAIGLRSSGLYIVWF